MQYRFNYVENFIGFFQNDLQCGTYSKFNLDNLNIIKYLFPKIRYEDFSR